jgi:hypothetical protein
MANQFMFANFWVAELLQNVSAADTLFNITPSIAAQLIINPGQEARLSVWDGQANPEIVGCTLNPGTGLLTVARAQEGTTAQAWPAGAQIRCVLTKEIINAALAAYFDITTVLNANFLKLSGGSLTGPLILASDPTSALQASTKRYVDSVQNTGLPTSGGTMSGTINMNNNPIINLPAPTTNANPATKLYVDTTKTDLTNRLADITGKLITGGTSTAYTLATIAAAADYVLADGLALAFQFHTANGAAPTLKVNAFAAAPLRRDSGIDLLGNEYPTGSSTLAVYNAPTSEWLIQDNFQGLSLQGFLRVVSAGVVMSPSGVVDFSGSGGVNFHANARLQLAADGAQPNSFMQLPYGSTAQRPASPLGAMFRYNTDRIGLEFFNSLAWRPISGATPQNNASSIVKNVVTSNTQIACLADSIVAQSAFNDWITIFGINSTVNFAVSGVVNGLDTGGLAANTWYHLWAVCKADTTGVGVIASLQSSVANFLTNLYAIAAYNAGYAAYMGAFRTNAAAQLMGMVQYGRDAQYAIGFGLAAVPAIITGASGNPLAGPSWTPTVIQAASGAGAWVPVTAGKVKLLLSMESVIGATAAAMAAPSAAYGVALSTTLPPPLCLYSNTVTGVNVVTSNNIVGDIILESTSVQYASIAAAQAGLYCLGFTLNL